MFIFGDIQFMELKCLRCSSTNLVEKEVEPADIYAFIDFETPNEKEIHTDVDILYALNVKMVVCEDCGHVEFFSRNVENVFDARNKELAAPEMEPILKEINSFNEEIKEIEKKIDGQDGTKQWVKDSKNRILRLKNKIRNAEYALDNVKRKYNLY